MIKYSDEQIVDLILEHYENKKIVILAPRIKGRKGHYRELFASLKKTGYTKVRVDGEIVEITSGMKLDRYKIHDIELVIDRLKVTELDRKRISESVVAAMKQGGSRWL